MILEFLKMFTFGSILGGIIVRVWFRLMMDVSLLNVKVNLSMATNRKFRLIELIPFLGTLLTHIKHDGENTNFAKQAFGMELLTGLTTFIILQLVDSVLPLFLALVWMTVFVAIIFDVLVKDGLSKAESMEKQIATSRRNPIGFTRRNRKGIEL